MFTLPPSVNEHKYIIGSDPQHYENAKGVEIWIVSVPDNTLIDQSGKSKRQQYRDYSQDS